MSTTVQKVAALARPRKLTSAIRRRWFEWRMPRLPRRPLDGVVPLGSDYGAYAVPVDQVQDSWTCYCIGTGADISFELELATRWQVQVRSFEAVEGLADYARKQAEGHPRVSVEHAALALADGPIRMQVSHVPASHSVSAAGLYESTNYVEAPGRTLASLIREHGDERIDLLKIDIEGLEYELLPSLDLPQLGVQVLCIQFHHNGGVRRAKHAITRLRTDGYELIGHHPAVKLTFARARLLS